MAQRPTTDTDLDALARGATARDPDAWEDLYRRLHPGLHSFARRRLPTNVAAEDAVSEAMIRAMDRIDSFEPRPATLAGWIFGILRNVVLEHQRAGAWTVPTDVIDGSDAAPLPGDRLIEAEQHQAMCRAFSSLGPQDQELLELRVLGGLTGDAAGELLGMKPGAVRMAQVRALDRLRAQFREVSGAD